MDNFAALDAITEKKPDLTGTAILGANSDLPFTARFAGNSGSKSHSIMAKEIAYLIAWEEYARGASRSTRRRICDFWAGVDFAEECGWVLNTVLTVSWETCLELQDQEGASLLDLPAGERCKRFRRGLARLCTKLGFPFVAVWARAISSHRRDHIHLLFWFPSKHREALVKWLEYVTGVWVSNDRAASDVIAQGDRGCWYLQENWRGMAGAIHVAAYIGVQHEKRGHRAPDVRKASGITVSIGEAEQLAAGFVWEALHLPSAMREEVA